MANLTVSRGIFLGSSGADAAIGLPLILTILLLPPVTSMALAHCTVCPLRRVAVHFLQRIWVALSATWRLSRALDSRIALWWWVVLGSRFTILLEPPSFGHKPEILSKWRWLMMAE